MVNLTSPFADPDTNDTHSFLWVVAASNGQVVRRGISGDFSFIPRDNGTYTVPHTVADNYGGQASETLTIEVVNVAPVISTSGMSSGNLVTVSIKNPSDASAEDFSAGLRYSFDFDNDGKFDLGDGTYAGSMASTSASFVPKHLRLESDGSASAFVRTQVIDKVGGISESVIRVKLTSPLPAILADSISALSTGAAVNVRGFTTAPGAPDVLQVVYEISGISAAPFELSVFASSVPTFDAATSTSVRDPIVISDAGLLSPGVHVLTLSDPMFGHSLNSPSLDFLLVVASGSKTSETTKAINFYGIYQNPNTASSHAAVIRGMDSRSRYPVSANDRIALRGESAGSVAVESKLTRKVVRLQIDDNGRILVVAADGDEVVRADEFVAQPLHIFGGLGADSIRGGAGKDQIIMTPEAAQHWNGEFYGESGNDTLIGASYRFGSDRGG